MMIWNGVLFSRKLATEIGEIRYQKILCFLGKDTLSPVLKDKQRWPGKEKVEGY